MRHTHGPCSAHPRCPPWQVGEDCVSRAARGRARLAGIARRRMWAARRTSRRRRERSRSASGTGACWASCDREAPDVPHMWVARRTSRRRPWQAGEGVRVARAARGGDVLCLRRSRGSGRATHVGRPAHIPPLASIGGAGSHCTNGTGMFSARGDHEAPDAAHTCAVQRTSPLPAVAGGRELHRASGTGTRWARCDREAPDAANTRATLRASRCRPWQSGAVASHELHWDVLGSRRSRRAGCCASVGCQARIPPHPTAGWQQSGAVSLHERHGDMLGATCPTRAIAMCTRRDTQCGRRAQPPAAHAEEARMRSASGT